MALSEMVLANAIQAGESELNAFDARIQQAQTFGRRQWRNMQGNQNGFMLRQTGRAGMPRLIITATQNPFIGLDIGRD
jgi:hypothetical protein